MHVVVGAKRFAGPCTTEHWCLVVGVGRCGRRRWSRGREEGGGSVFWAGRAGMDQPDRCRRTAPPAPAGSTTRPPTPQPGPGHGRHTVRRKVGHGPGTLGERSESPALPHLIKGVHGEKGDYSMANNITFFSVLGTHASAFLKTNHQYMT